MVHETPGEEPESAEHLGYFGIGNGTAFAFTGTWYPLNTLHELIGPEYDNSHWLFLRLPGQPPPSCGAPSLDQRMDLALS